ncbi:unnamed protein product [Closterium sp. Yama58-4]|nr:unnamed protein product [Closterium sp. Yama58-4]
MNNGIIGKEGPGKSAFLDSGPPLLKRTGHARRYSLGGSGDYPRSISANGMELSRADSLSSHRRPAFPPSKSLSTSFTAGLATEAPGREEESGPGRGTIGTSDRRSRGKNGLARLGDDGSEGYDSDEEFVKLYGLVAQHRAAERAIVSNTFAKVLAKPASSGCSPRVGTGSSCGSIRSGGGRSPTGGTGSGCSSIARSRSGCLSMAPSGSGCSPKDGTRPKFTSQSGSGSSFRWAGGDIISTTNDKTCGMAAADEHEGSAPGCADMLPNHGSTSVEPLLLSPKAAALGPRAAIKGNSGNAPCAVLRNRSRMSLDSAVVNVAFTGADERESVESLMDLGKIQMNQRIHGHEQQSQREKGFLRYQSVAVMGTPVASPLPARCAKPENSRVVISQGEGGALEVRIPAAGFFPDGAVGWILCLLTPFLIAIAVAVAIFLPFTICILCGYAACSFAWIKSATRSETIVLSPDIFTITTSSSGSTKRKQGSTLLVRAIVVQNLNSPQPLPPPPVHSIAAQSPIPPPPAPLTRSAAKPAELVCMFVGMEQEEYRFGKTLSDAEKHWVVGELSHHLHTMHMLPAQQNV